MLEQQVDRRGNVVSIARRNGAAENNRYNEDIAFENAELIDIDRLRLDGGTQTRAFLDQKIIDSYASVIRAGADFPPVLVYDDDGVLWLVDGFLTYCAYEFLGRTQILSIRRPGTIREAILCALKKNSHHGLRRSSADKRKAVLIALSDEEWSSWSNVEIASRCGVDEGNVRNVKKLLSSEFPKIEEIAEKYGVSYEVVECAIRLLEVDSRKVRRGDTTYSMNISSIGKNGDAAIAKVVNERSGLIIKDNLLEHPFQDELTDDHRVRPNTSDILYPETVENSYSKEITELVQETSTDSALKINYFQEINSEQEIEPIDLITDQLESSVKDRVRAELENLSKHPLPKNTEIIKSEYPVQVKYFVNTGKEEITMTGTLVSGIVLLDILGEEELVSLPMQNACLQSA
jgi:hypothetical protein